MNKTLLSAALIAGFGVAAFAPQAANAAANTSSGTITITGAIVASTCNASVTGGTGGNGAVTLPTVDTGALSTVGSSAGWTALTITLTGCSAVTGTGISPLPTTVFPYFTGANIDTGNGYLKNTGSSNVEIALSNGASLGNPLTLQNGSGSQNALTQTLPTTGTATLAFNYYVGYVASKAVASAGNVSTTVQYDLNYQ